MTAKKISLVLFAAVFLLAVLGCAPGNERWASVDNKANFWAGLWHGLIILITFVVSWFTNDVGIYESTNVGFGYNIGFILGCMISLGGGAKATTRRKRKAKIVYRKPDWDKVGHRIEAGVREGMKAAFKDQEPAREEKDWDELGQRIEERIKEKMKDWEQEE